MLLATGHLVADWSCNFRKRGLVSCALSTPTANVKAKVNFWEGMYYCISVYFKVRPNLGVYPGINSQSPFKSICNSLETDIWFWFKTTRQNHLKDEERTLWEVWVPVSEGRSASHEDEEKQGRWDCLFCSNKSQRAPHQGCHIYFQTCHHQWLCLMILLCI